MNLLEKARSYENEYTEIYGEEHPVFHMSPPVGWMNDPNGFSLFRGEYHLFFQYYPYDTVWGTMHWGHAKTRDFIRWDYLPAALAPDMPYDKNGCFSGSAIEIDGGKQLILYSGVTPLNYTLEKPVEDLPPDSDQYQNLCVAIGDGIDFQKLDTNPMLLASSAPGQASLVDFRDPKIWQEEDGYYAVVSNRSENSDGDILLYKSDNCIRWEFCSTLFSNNGNFGKMWECPDLFSLDGRDVLLVSPMEMKKQGLEYHDGHVAVAFIGKYERENHIFLDEKNQAIDYGIDFYSTQTLATGDGRRIMIAWMQNWGERDIQPEGLHFFGQNTIPRELEIKEGRLIQNPVREIENYRQDKVLYHKVDLSSETDGSFLTLPGIEGRVLDMTIQLSTDQPDTFTRFDLQLAQDENHHLLLQYFPQENIISVDRRNCGKIQEEVKVGKFYVRDMQGCLKLRILLDKYSIELFANDGEQAASYVFYTGMEADGIRFRGVGHVKMDIEQYKIEV